MAARFSGHESFPCRYAWIPKALQAIKNNSKIFSLEDEAMVELGVGRNMVKSIKFWIEAAGMVQPVKNGGLHATWLGDQIFKPRDGYDPYLEDMQTLWLIHWKLCTHVEHPLFAWDYLFNRWQEVEFTETAVLETFRREADGQSKRLSPVTLEQHLQVFLHTYLPTGGRKGDLAEDNLDCPLTELQLISRVGERERSNGHRGREPVYGFHREEKPTISAGLFAYFVNDFWQRSMPNEKTLSVRSLVMAPRSPGTVLKLPEQDIYSRIQGLEALSKGRIRYSDSGILPQLQRNAALSDKGLLAEIYH